MSDERTALLAPVPTEEEGLGRSDVPAGEGGLGLQQDEVTLEDSRTNQQPPAGICRICREGKDAGMGDLIYPCRCRGSIKYVHRECLDLWRAAGGSAFRCEICHTEYEFEAYGASVQVSRVYLKTLQVSAACLMAALFVFCAGCMGAALSRLGAWKMIGDVFVGFWYEQQYLQDAAVRDTPEWARVALMGFVGMGVAGWVLWPLIVLLALLRNSVMMLVSPEWVDRQVEEGNRLYEIWRNHRESDPDIGWRFFTPSHLQAPIDRGCPAPRLCLFLRFPGGGSGGPGGGGGACAKACTALCCYFLCCVGVLFAAFFLVASPFIWFYLLIREEIVRKYRVRNYERDVEEEAVEMEEGRQRRHTGEVERREDGGETTALPSVRETTQEGALTVESPTN
uniref:RING-CH-type domain-containing protein n=1 Tax=Chromera velia CCMP2878 TaxID=1169474 RepID=A0A0G4I5S3_9ALVE|eukprot:Cvel_53.t1-p1 / transcript=Cvel_53.t1 / gene=Cvel_53 / organism=Chromera_velia_CCMP2878 / gene_product=E3 ubiquitin-protein ligase MARCH2, putative / transcript_product=E3 ubiquitin-protein ligase MARCH2, putative / location=Cvel_scaffold6:10224-11552(-) / protein_length=394 / sequence_SO=supercontig / SO=protein_coding / is_pseudo=false